MKFKSYKYWLNESEMSDVIVLLPGSYKPMHSAHVELIKRYVQHPDVKEIKILIGPGIRNGITQNEAVEIAELLLKDFDNISIEAVKYPSPILTAYKYIMEEATSGTYVMGSSKKDSDYARVLKFVKDFSVAGKYYEMKPKDVNVIELSVEAEPIMYKGRTDEYEGTPISASVLRNDILNDDYNNFRTNYPEYDENIIKEIWDKSQMVISENLNEKFTEDSDPIHDMGIGMQVLLDKFLEQEKKDAGWYGLNFNDINEQLRVCAYYGKENLVDYLLSKGADPSYDNSRALRNTFFSRNKKIAFKLIEAGANIDIVMRHMSDDKIKFFEEIKREIMKWKDIKESLNEVFTEDSDPIDDMGIGMKHQIEKWAKDTLKEEGWRHEYIDSINNLLWVCAAHGKINFANYLLEKGADIHSITDYPIRWACYRGQYEMVKFLLSKGANIFVPHDGANAIYYASQAQKNREKIVKLINNHKLKEERKNKVKESLNEMSSSQKLNLHMSHLEDLVFSGKNEFIWSLGILNKLYEKLKGNIEKDDVKLSIKFDGSPAIFGWSDFPELGKNGIAIKGLFAKDRKIMYNDKDVDKFYGDKKDLANKLKLFLKHISSLNIPKNEIWQGDFLFDKDTLVDEGQQYSFHPNTIVYKINKDSNIGKEISQADIGLVWHTRYVGKSLSDIQVFYNTSISELISNPRVFMTDPYISSLAGYVTLNTDEDTEISEKLQDIDEISKNNLYSLKSYEKLVGDKEVIELFKIFQNSLIRKFVNIDNAKDYLHDFVSFVDDRLTQESDNKKTEKGKQTIIDKKNDIIDRIDDVADVFETGISVMMLLIDLKKIFIKKLNNIGKFETYLKTREGKFKSTSQEGFAVSDIEGNVVKLVDRNEFSYANFSNDILKGWSKI